MRKKYPIIQPGDRFGEWTVIDKDATKYKYYICRCSCGSELKSIYDLTLHKGTSRSCGCSHSNTTKNETIRSVINNSYLKFLSSNRRREIENNITIGEFSLIMQQNCAYSNLSPSESN